MSSFPPDRIETQRLLLRRPVPSDAQAAFDGWCQDAEVTRFLGWPPHTAVSESEAYVKKTMAAWEDGAGYRDWVMERDGEVLGMIGTRVEAHRVEIGYVLGRAHWGQGVVTEATQAVIHAAFADPKIERVLALCDAANGGSARVMEKAGMRYEGLMRQFAPHPNLGPDPRDCHLYARVRSDAKSHRAQPLRTERGAACATVLRALPDWFGLEASVQAFVRDVEDMSCWVTHDDNGDVASFLAISLHTQRSAEVHVMGVLPAFQGQGHGTELLTAAEQSLARDGVRYLQVKTLSSARPDPFYDRTRAFYLSRGFEPLTELPGPWDRANPCLQLLKRL